MTPAHNSELYIGKNIKVTALHTPCHTQDSICWYMEDTSSSTNSPPEQPKRAVFTGDTLFIGGCGRFFEGTPAEMNTALNKVLAALPDDTAVYPGHEYTKNNCKFSVTVTESEDVKQLQRYSENNRETQGRFTVGDEKRHNVFMQVDSTEMQKVTGEKDPVGVMGKLRSMKDSF